jgi:hypothetical protein
MWLVPTYVLMQKTPFFKQMFQEENQHAFCINSRIFLLVMLNMM